MKPISLVNYGPPAPAMSADNKETLPESRDNSPPPRGVRAVDRAIAILQCFTSQEPELTLSQIADRVDLSKPTVHRFLLSLERGGFLARANQSKSYRLGMALVQLASLSVREFDIREVSRPHMLKLSNHSGCVVHLGILDGDSVVYIEKIEPTGNVLQLKSHVGSRQPLHCTALGKVLLANLPVDVQSQTLSSLVMTRYTDSTIGTVSQLTEELARVQRQQYAIDDGELNKLVRCAAAPIRNRDGEVICALSVSSVGLDVQSAIFARIVDNVIEVAADVSSALGYTSSGTGQQHHVG